LTDRCTINLFSYGTLQLDSVQMACFGRLLQGRKDAMPRYRKDVVEITDPEVIRTSGERFHPIVVPSDDPSDAVEGKVFRITPEELAAADHYEVSDYKQILPPTAGSARNEVKAQETCKHFSENKERLIALLRKAISTLEEEIADAEPVVVAVEKLKATPVVEAQTPRPPRRGKLPRHSTVTGAA
jgi:hypothetical protein